MTEFQQLQRDRREWLRFLLPLAASILAWLAVVKVLWSDWMIDPQYGYGFIVPLLVLGLLWRRAQALPLPVIPGNAAILWADGIVIGGALILAAVIPMAEANPDWRPLGIFAACADVAIALALILQLGGWGWLRALAFPLCFFLIAVPWPRNFEQSVMTSLVSLNTDATIEILHWLGYGAMRHGNLIIIPAGILGVEEACSGIRSLQGGLMVALFFGEYFWLSGFRRILLLVVAVLGAMFGNLVRSSLLAIVASAQGMSAVSLWHDPAGYLVLVITVVSIGSCALTWRKESGEPEAVRSGREGFHFLSPLPLRASSLGALVFVVMILLFSYAGMEYWFRSHERTLAIAPEWDLLPRSGTEAVPVAVPSTTLKLLFNPIGFSEKWRRKDGEQGQVFYFRWPPGRIAVQSILAMHSPAVCLSNIGMKLKSELAPAIVNVAGISLQFHSWLFEQNGHSIYVFNAMPLNVQVPGNMLSGLDDSPRGRLHGLLAGLRNKGQRMIEVAFWNSPNEAAARTALAAYLNEAMARPAIEKGKS